MSGALSGIIGMSMSMLVTVLVFQIMDIVWNTQVYGHQEFTQRIEERQATAIDVESTSDTTTDCLTYTATVANTGDTVVTDFTEMDILVQYTGSGENQVASRLVYTSNWIISMSPDSRDPNAWNPDETATITFTLLLALKDNTLGTVVVVTPQGVLDSSYFSCICAVSDTGYLSPTTQAADTGGDGDGFESDPTNAFADDASSATNVGGDGDRHRFYDYGISLKSSCGISGIEVRLDWWLSALGGGNSMDVELSWDGGTSWTAAKTDAVESTSERSAILGGSSDTWGRTWAAAELSDSNFWARVTTNGSGGLTYYLDWAPVKVYYAP